MASEETYNKVLRRVLTEEDDRVALAARTVLRNMLKADGHDPLQAVIVVEEFAYRAIKALERQLDEMHDRAIKAEVQAGDYLDKLTKARRAAKKPRNDDRVAALEEQLRQANLKMDAQQPPQARPVERRRGKRRHLAWIGGMYAFRYRYPPGADGKRKNVVRRLYTTEEAVAEELAAELLVKVKAGEAI